MKPTKTKKPQSKLDPFRIYEQADSFSRAFDILSISKTREERLSVVRPAMVMSAFSSELFLKCIIYLEGSDVPASHDLKKLFDLLSAPMKQRVEKLWQEAIRVRKPFLDRVETETGGSIKRGLTDALSTGARAFEDSRYYYEKSTEEIRNMEFILSDLPIVLKMAIWEAKPQWISKYDVNRVRKHLDKA